MKLIFLNPKLASLRHSMGMVLYFSDTKNFEIALWCGVSRVEKSSCYV
jgi:hypothetical protein